jgi:hypothetical protein
MSHSDQFTPDKQPLVPNGQDNAWAIQLMSTHEQNVTWRSEIEPQLSGQIMQSIPYNAVCDVTQGTYFI